MSNLALLYNKGHDFEKTFWPKKFPKTEYFPTKNLHDPDELALGWQKNIHH